MNLLIFYLTVLLATYCIYIFKTNNSFELLICFAWLLPVTFMYIGFIKYDDIESKTSFILCIYFLLFLTGSMFTKYKLFLLDVSKFKIGGLFKASVILLFAVTIIQCLFIIMPKLGAGINLTSIRDVHWKIGSFSQGAAHININENLLRFTSVFTVVYACPLLLYFKKKQIGLAIMATVSLIVLVIKDVVIHAGRFELVIIVLMIIVSNKLLGNIVNIRLKIYYYLKSIKAIIAIIILLIVGYYVSIVFIWERSQWVEKRGIDYILARAGSGEVSKIGSGAKEILGVRGGYLIFSSSYFTKPITTLDYFITTGIAESFNGKGTYIFRNLFTPFGNNNFYEIRNHISLSRRAQNLSENPWATSYRDYIIDFGLIGGGLFAMFSGFISKLGYLFIYKSNRIEAITLSTLCVINVIFIPYCNILVDGTIIYSIIVGLSICLLSKFK
jgi:hypothetical protein